MSKTLKSPLHLALLIGMLLIICSAAHAQFEELIPDDDPDIPWRIFADQVEFDQVTQQYRAKGNVTIKREDLTFTADRLIFDRDDLTVIADGDVVIQSDAGRLTGARIELNLAAETGTIHNGDIFLRANHFYIRGDRIEKVGRATYEAFSASVTSCDGKTPDWKITGNHVKVTIEGYGYVTHAALWAKKIPLLYTPFFFFPVKEKRQTGLLVPRLDHSDRKGFSFTQPLYLAIDKSSDATFYDHYMADRGHKFGAEYRYVLDQSKGTLMANYLDDEKIDDGTADASENWGYTDDSAIRTNESRYWIRIKHDQDLPLGLTGEMDIDIVSDQDYLHEFRDGYTGFDRTERYFRGDFGRELDDYTDPVRTNRLRLYRWGTHYAFYGEARWYDDVIDEPVVPADGQGVVPVKKRDDTLHMLPMITFDTVLQPLWNTSLNWKMDSEYTYFHREEGTTGHRADLYPRFFYPLRFGPYFTLEPSLGLRETFWAVEEESTASDPLTAGEAPLTVSEEETFRRETYDIRIDLSTHLYRVYRPGMEGIEGIKHTLLPRIYYEYVEEEDQEEYPFFDPKDRIGVNNRITYSLTNLFTARLADRPVPERTPKFSTTKEELPKKIPYVQFCRLNLEQSYDIREADEGPLEGTKEKEPFSPILAELMLTPSPSFSLIADAEWDVYDGDLNSRNIAATLRDGRGDSLFAEHRYTRELSESIYASLMVKATSTLSLYGDYERDLQEDKAVRTGVGFTYLAGCWSADLKYTEEEQEEQYTLMINLHGLGGFSTSQ